MSAIREELTKGVRHLADLLGIGKGALDIPDDDEDEEEPDEALADVAEEAEEAADALGDEEEPPIGKPPEKDQPPTAEDLDEMLEELGEMDDERDREQAASDEEEDDEMSKAVRDLLEGDDLLGPVLDADEAFGRAFEIITKAVGARFDAQEQTISALRELMEAQSEALDVLVKSAAVQEEREQAREAAAQEFAAVRGAMPAGRVIRKSPKDEAEDTAGDLNDRITKALQTESITALDAGVLRKQLQYGQTEEVKAALDRAEAMPTGAG